MACNNCKKKTATSEPSKKPETNFKFRDVGVHQINFGDGDFISNENMTDELALKFLKENPNRISLFDKFISSWKDLLNNKNAKDENV